MVSAVALEGSKVADCFVDSLFSASLCVYIAGDSVGFAFYLVVLLLPADEIVETVSLVTESRVLKRWQGTAELRQDTKDE